MNDKSKLILSLLGLSDAGAACVRAVMSARFPQFKFEGGAGLVSPEARSEATGRHDVFAVGPWHLSARERPSLDMMRMFGEGAAAAVLSFERRAATHAASVEAVLAQEAP